MTLARRSLPVAMLVLLVAACSGGGGGSSGSPSSANGGASQPADGTSGPSSGGGGGTGTLPGDPCTIVKVEDVTAIYGGDVVADPEASGDGCSFLISGTAKAGSITASAAFAVTTGDDHATFETAKMLFGDQVTKIDGLGTDAYSYGGFIHAQVGAGELVVGGVFVGTLDRAAVAQETFDMTKLLLGRL